VCSSYIEVFNNLGCYTVCIASKLLTFRDNLPVQFSRDKQDSVGKNHRSTLMKVPKDHRSHFVVDYIFPAKPVLFLMENQYCQAIMPQEAVNNCLMCIKCAEVSYSWLF
jgi:hypothetical protein